MKKAYTGQIHFGDCKTELSSSPLGSCVAVVMFDSTKKVGGMAHVMLPGKAPQNNTSKKLRYAADAIAQMVEDFVLNGSGIGSLQACIIGGSNVLRRENDKIANDNVASVQQILKEISIPIIAESVGGFERRTAKINLAKSYISYTQGDKSEKVLYSY